MVLRSTTSPLLSPSCPHHSCPLGACPHGLDYVSPLTSFAAVWLAEYAGQEVAVKVNLPAGAGGTVVVVPQEVTDMFVREAEMTSRLSHR
jgi:hypothetical protein